MTVMRTTFLTEAECMYLTGLGWSGVGFGGRPGQLKGAL